MATDNQVYENDQNLSQKETNQQKQDNHCLQSKQEEVKIYYPSKSFKKTAHLNSLEEYQRLYKKSIDSPEEFWLKIALEEFYWKVEPKRENFLSYNFDTSRGSIFVEWMKQSQTNICYNAIDRVIDSDKQNGQKIAYIWEGNSPDDLKTITYNELRIQVSKFANVLKLFNVVKGSRVALYMPVSIELVTAMLACARIGAIHVVIFAGFSADALASRMFDAKCMALVTADGYYRGTKLVGLKQIASDALDRSAKLGNKINVCIVHKRLDLPIKTDVNDNILSTVLHTSPQQQQSIPWDNSVDSWWCELMSKASDKCEPVWMDSIDPLFILYTSGSTGEPKGIVHSTGGYMLYTATTFKYVFDYSKEDIFFCTADFAWITGHSISIYGSLCNGATVVLLEGTPFYPSPARLWQMVERHKVTTFYTAPTAIRSLMRYDESYVTSNDTSSLRLLCTAGEPINYEAWHWYYELVGKRKCPIVDTFFQTETSAPMLTPLPGCTPLKPGSATLPFFGVEPAIINEQGKEIKGSGFGELVFKSPWPGMLKCIDHNQVRFEESYFSKYPSCYVTGDHARRDEDGYYWLLGRADDMLNVSGHLLSTAEIDFTLTGHKKVAEAVAVSYLHQIKGEALFCYVVLKKNYVYNDKLEEELKCIVKEKIGSFAVPDKIKCLKQLPKTRSGKVMRRILRKASRNDTNIGDISTLANKSALDDLFPTGYNSDSGNICSKK